MVKLSMTRFRPVKFRMGQVHLKKGGLSCKGATKAADLSQPDICCGPEPDMCCTICSRDQSFQDNYRKWVELRAKSSGTPDIKYRVPPPDTAHVVKQVTQRPTSIVLQNVKIAAYPYAKIVLMRV